MFSNHFGNADSPLKNRPRNLQQGVTKWFKLIGYNQGPQNKGMVAAISYGGPPLKPFVFNKASWQ